MLSDINWWLTFLPHFNGTTMIQRCPFGFQDVLFTHDSNHLTLHRGGSTCFNECILFDFTSLIENLALHITALKLFILVIAVKIWAPKLAGTKFQISCNNKAAVQIANSAVHRIRSCSAAYENSGLPQHALIWSCTFFIFPGVTTSLRTA